MNTTLKSLAVAAFAAFTSLAAPASVQAQDLFYNDGQITTVGGYYEDDDGFRPRFHQQRHYYPRHHRNGFSFEFQFGQPRVFYQPRHPRPIYQPRPVIHLTQAHVQWCYNRYRTYNHRSNSFVIRHGQRAYCVSPYSY